MNHDFTMTHPLTNSNRTHVLPHRMPVPLARSFKTLAGRSGLLGVHHSPLSERPGDSWREQTTQDQAAAFLLFAVVAAGPRAPATRF